MEESSIFEKIREFLFKKEEISEMNGVQQESMSLFDHWKSPKCRMKGAAVAGAGAIYGSSAPGVGTAAGAGIGYMIGSIGCVAAIKAKQKVGSVKERYQNDSIMKRLGIEE